MSELKSSGGLLAFPLEAGGQLGVARETGLGVWLPWGELWPLAWRELVNSYVSTNSGCRDQPMHVGHGGAIFGCGEPRVPSGQNGTMDLKQISPSTKILDKL